MKIEDVKAAAARQLTDQEIMILTLFCSMSAIEIGEVLDLSRQRVSDVIKSAKAKIKAQSLASDTAWIR